MRCSLSLVVLLAACGDNIKPDVATRPDARTYYPDARKPFPPDLAPLPDGILEPDAVDAGVPCIETKDHEWNGEGVGHDNHGHCP